MKIETMTKQDALNLMGGEATDAEAVEMLCMLAMQGEWTDTDQISDGLWRRLIALAVRRATKASAMAEARTARPMDGAKAC